VGTTGARKSWVRGGADGLWRVRGSQGGGGLLFEVVAEGEIVVGC